VRKDSQKTFHLEKWGYLFFLSSNKRKKGEGKEKERKGDNSHSRRGKGIVPPGGGERFAYDCEFLSYFCSGKNVSVKRQAIGEKRTRKNCQLSPPAWEWKKERSGYLGEFLEMGREGGEKTESLTKLVCLERQGVCVEISWRNQGE